MAATDTLQRTMPYVERLVDNGYLQENVREGVANLRAAYGRARGRKAAKAAQDRKIHRRIQHGVSALAEAAVALKTGREKPRRRGRAVLMLVLAGGGVALAASAERRERVLSAISGSSDGAGSAAAS